MEIKIETFQSPSKKGKDVNIVGGLRLAKRSSIKDEAKDTDKVSLTPVNMNRVKNLKKELLGEIRKEGSRSSFHTLS